MTDNTLINDPWFFCEQRINTAAEKTNACHTAAYKRFIKWYKENRHNTELALTTTEGPHGTIFITQHNLDQYYSTKLINSNAGVEGVRKPFLACDWYLNHVENRDANKSNSYKLQWTTTIKKAIREQNVNCKQTANVRNAGVDPHKGIKDLLSETDNNKIIKYILKHRTNDCVDLLVDYTWGRNAGVRGQSCRQFKFSDLNLSLVFGPESSAPRNRTLLIILRKGDVHKDKYTTDKQVGVYQHRDYKQCSVFATALLIIRNLRDYGRNNINFFHANKKRRASWWDKKLTKFSKRDQSAAAVKEFIRNTKVEISKVTHHRTQAVLLGGVRGLTDSQISSFTKHRTDKLHTSYTAEVEEQVLHVMAGFCKYETHQVREEYVEFPRADFLD